MGLEQYLVPLIRRWWLILIAVLIAVTSCALFLRNQPATYQARATVMVGQAMESPNPNGNDLTLTAQLASTYADIANRDPLRRAVLAALGLKSMPVYMVRVVPNTQLIEVTATNNDPQRAALIANEVARQVVLMSPSSTDQNQTRQDFINEELDGLEAGIKETRDTITKKQGELTGMFSARQIDDTQAQIAALESKLTALQSNYAMLLQNTQRGAINIMRIIDPAVPPTVPIGPSKMAYLVLAAATGLLISVMGAYVMDYLDDTMKSSSDVERYLSLDTLCSVPYLKALANSNSPLSINHPYATEAYGILRTNLQFASVGQSLQSLVITSPAASDGKSTVAASIAIALAQTDQKVILVDSDLRRPRAHRLFGLPNNTGLTTAMLQPGCNVDDLLRQTDLPALRVLTSGPLPPNPAAMLSSTRMRAFLNIVKGHADIVVFDCPPAGIFADAAIVAAQSDATLLVVRVGRTRRRMAQRALASIKRVNAQVIGAVLNETPVKTSDYYYYQDHYRGSEVSDTKRNGAHRHTEQPKRVPRQET